MLTAATPDLSVLPARDRILLTAHDLFYREGIRATGIDRVIAASGVTKVTFYRHFPSKNELVLAYLEHRHQRWMAWFTDALQRHGAARKGLAALVPTLTEWLSDGHYRGCAFINAVGELGGALPDVVAVAQRHKADMAAAIEQLLSPSRQRPRDAALIAMAVDGAIVHAQIEATPEAALASLARLVKLQQAAAAT
ncbi:TetR/AcrR family transcriptional regulator [Ideonella sp. BN130291]|uniref:TetR/AcrR family transcriptional regulator n=1 Tax=Ideonella sp. BN130291 TaxID=3112940 RepID=UPI002E2688B2|nr:TetR/AcrR family transcriptional regulator [Ideonella sp. BN130291]